MKNFLISLTALILSACAAFGFAACAEIVPENVDPSDLSEYESLPYTEGKIQTREFIGASENFVEIVTSADGLAEWGMSDVYDGEFFKTNSLVFAIYRHSSSIVNITFSGIIDIDSKLSPVISADIPEAANDDVHYTVFSVEMKNSDIQGLAAGDILVCGITSKIFSNSRAGIAGKLKEGGASRDIPAVEISYGRINGIAEQSLLLSDKIVMINSSEQFAQYDIKSLYSNGFYESGVVTYYTDEFFEKNELILYEFYGDESYTYKIGDAVVDGKYCPVVCSQKNGEMDAAYMIGSVEVKKSDNISVGDIIFTEWMRLI